MFKLKPTSPGRRGTIKTDRSRLSKGKADKKLSFIKLSANGRNNQGKITVRHKGGAGKRRYRMIDFCRNITVPAKVMNLEYDPFRSAHVARIMYEDGRKSYIIAPRGLEIGNKIISSTGSASLNVGNCMPLENIPEGVFIHNLELRPGKGAQLARSAGAYAHIIAKDSDSDYVLVKLRSGEVRRVFNRCRATIGTVSNTEHNLIKYGKAGASRHRGIRPTVRGAAMCGADHPHGGGEGKTRGKLPKTKWGKPAKGRITRNNKRTNKYIARSRRQNKQ